MISKLYAMAPSQPGPGEGPSAFMSFLPLLVIFALFYFLLIRPQQKQQKERQALLKELKGGEHVVTVSGVYGTVTKVNDDETLQLQIAENVKIKVTRQAIERLVK